MIRFKGNVALISSLRGRIMTGRCRTSGGDMQQHTGMSHNLGVERSLSAPSDSIYGYDRSLTQGRNAYAAYTYSNCRSTRARPY